MNIPLPERSHKLKICDRSVICQSLPNFQSGTPLVHFFQEIS